MSILDNILCDLDPKVKLIGKIVGIWDGVPLTAALFNFFNVIYFTFDVCSCMYILILVI